MDESPTAVASSPDVPRKPVSESPQLEQWNWVARARSAAARSLGLVSESGPRPVEAADPGQEPAPAP